jgi:hypothetical protein
VGDVILVRDGAQDSQVVDEGEYTRDRGWVGRTYLEHGQHTVTSLSAELHRGHRSRASRYYTVHLDNGQAVVCSSVQRWNRVLP